jgi:hypothetical protein
MRGSGVIGAELATGAGAGGAPATIAAASRADASAGARPATL